MQKKRATIAPLRSLPGGKRRRSQRSLTRLRFFVVGSVLSILALAWWLWQPQLVPQTVFGPPSERAESEPLALKTADTVLTKRLEQLSNQPNLRTGIFALELQKGLYITSQDQATFSSASTIKLPILLALLQDIERGLVQWDEPLTLTKAVKVPGSGFLQYRPLGTKLRLWEVTNFMITESDNTATEMLIARLGGRERLNGCFSWWGLQQTVLRAPLPDIKGQNTTSPKDLAVTLNFLEQGKGISSWNRDRAFDLLSRVKNRNFLPMGLNKVEPLAHIAHKTGTIGISIGDAALIDLPNGKRYLLVVMIERPREDQRAVKLIQDISTQVAQSWSSKVAVIPTTRLVTPQP